MKMPAHEPPRWAERILERLLPARARQVVVGDLREEYVEAMLPRRGKLRADMWYIQQVASFVPQFNQERGPMGMILSFVSWFTLASTCWLAVMEMLLRHAGYELRASMACGFAIICLATILVRMLRMGKRAERWLWVGAAVLIGFGGEAFVHNARADHFEGFVFVISLALMLQGALMLMTLGWPTPGNERWLRQAGQSQ
jgi:hypothetical protein